jgi:hypothetical protein
LLLSRTQIGTRRKHRVRKPAMEHNNTHCKLLDDRSGGVVHDEDAARQFAGDQPAHPDTWPDVGRCRGTILGPGWPIG